MDHNAVLEYIEKDARVGQECLNNVDDCTLLETLDQSVTKMVDHNDKTVLMRARKTEKSLEKNLSLIHI